MTFAPIPNSIKQYSIIAHSKWKTFQLHHTKYMKVLLLRPLNLLETYIFCEMSKYLQLNILFFLSNIFSVFFSM